MSRQLMARLVGCCAVAVAVAVSAGPARADEHRDHDFHDHEFRGREFREHDVHRFGREDLDFWRAGGWRHERRDGRFGWWWVVGGTWYFYERPVYPYPLVVSEVAIPPTVVVAPPPPVVVQPPPQMVSPPPGMWYYCDNPRGYYPYVASCSVPFRPVPAAPQ